MTPTKVVPAALIAVALAVAGVFCAGGLMIMSIFTGSDSAQAGCGTPVVDLSANPSDPAAFQQWNGLQVANASMIVAVGKHFPVPDRGVVIALAVAMQESGLLNHANSNVPSSLSIPHQAVSNNYDSVGLFQQRPLPPDGHGSWGTLEELMTPGVAAQKFYNALLQIPGWQNMELTNAAQQVQHSSFPDAYAKWEPFALALAAHVSGDTSTSGNTGPCLNACPVANPSNSNTGISNPCADLNTIFARAKSWLTAWSGGPVPYLSSNEPGALFGGYRRDCSGYVSMALGLPGPGLNTTDFAARSTILEKSQIQPGDLMINPAPDSAGHMVLFERWVDHCHKHPDDLPDYRMVSVGIGVD